MTHFRHEGKGELCKDGSSYKGQGRSMGSEHQTMRTYTHGMIGYLLLGQRPRHEQRLAILGEPAHPVLPRPRIQNPLLVLGISMVTSAL
jgi:hypothetical protein